jgi:hypothetical protein
MRRILFLLPIFILLWGCEEIEAPYFEEEYLAQLPADERCLIDSEAQPAFPEGEAIEKMVLIEEMTGHKCGNCPRATEVAYDLYRNQFDGQVVLVGIHAGPLATFSPNDPKYFTNYTTEAGDEFYQELNSVNAVPFGLIDRVQGGSDASQWADYVQARLDIAPTAGIRLFNCHDSGDSSFSTVVNLKYLTEASNQRLSLLLVEDQIVSYQKDYSAPNGSPDIPDYTHHYILRGAINGTWGQPVSPEPIENGDLFTQSYSFELDLAAWNPANCYVIAFVYDESTDEVGQVAKAPLVTE